MKSSHLLQLLKQGYFVIPLYLFQLKEKFMLSIEEFLFLIYLMNQGERFPFNPTVIGKQLGYDLSKVMELVSNLTDKHFIEVEVSKNENGVMEEYISMNLFYEKVNGLLVEEFTQTKDDTSESIYEVFEKEFGRTLSPMEYEIIKAWLDSNTSRELILKALKEATYNGVANLRYIDKILYEWGKKGFQSAKDVEMHQLKRREEVKEKPKTEIFDYNWFDDEEER